MKTSIKTIGLLAALAMGLADPPSPVQAAEHFWDEIPLSPAPRCHPKFWMITGTANSRGSIARWLPHKTPGWFSSVIRSPGHGRSDPPLVGRFGKISSRSSSHQHGNSGDITPVMLHRVTRGNLDFPNGRHPEVAVILCGINNFGVTKAPAARKSGTWVRLPAGGHRPRTTGDRPGIPPQLPQTRLIMMALLPVADSAKWQKCQRVNAINANLALESDEVAFINLQDSFLQPDGTINKALFTDGTHLTKGGLSGMGKRHFPVIEKFMKAPPLAPVKIMLIGGSATEGLDSSTSYRRYLDGMIRRSGHLSDFVGSRHKHKDGTAEPDSYQFDPDHEGHWGRDSEWIADNMPRLLERNVPDVAVIHLGAEDILANKTEAEPLTDGIIKNIDRVITALRLKSAKVKIVIAQNLPVRGREETCVLLNQKIARLARSSASTLSPVVFAEANQRFEPHHDMSKDDALPNASGARKIAGTLSNAINTLLGPSSNQTTPSHGNH